MTLDLWILAALGLFAAMGFYTGAIQQFSHWIGIAAAYLCAKPLAAVLAPVLAERMGWPPLLTAVGLSAISMPILLVCATLIARMILNAIIPGDQRNMPDRLAGIVLGAGKAGVIVWAALAVVLAFEETVVKYQPGMKDAMNASSAVAFTRKHSLFESASSPALLSDPRLKKLLEDPKLAKTIEGMRAK